MMTGARPKLTNILSEFSSEEINIFLDNFHSASSKNTFLSSTLKKSYFRKQLIDLLSEFLWKNKLGYYQSGKLQQNSTTISFNGTVAILVIMKKYRHILSSDCVTMFRSSPLLKYIKRTYYMKLNKLKSPNLPKEMLVKYIAMTSK